MAETLAGPAEETGAATAHNLLLQQAAPRKMRLKGRYSKIGLDLGSSQIKLAQLKHKNGQIYLWQYGIYPLPEGALEGGKVEDPGLLAERLQWVLQRRRFHKRRVNLCVGSQNVVLRQVLLPEMHPKEIPSAVRWEAEKQVMMPLEETVVDYLYLGRRLVDDKMMIELALVAVPKEVVNGYLEAVTGAGFYPEAIEIESLALQRMLNLELPGGAAGDPAISMLLDLGAEYSNLVLLKNGHFRFARTLSIGVDHFCRRVAEAGQLSLETARRQIFSRDPFSLDGFQEVADDLANQVSRSMEYYANNIWDGKRQGSEQEMEINRMLFCGGGAAIDRLASFLGFELKVEPKLLSPLEFIQAGKKLYQPDLEQEENMLNVAVGLALRGWR